MAGDISLWWDSADGCFWPEGADRGSGLEALKSCFEVIGYEVCPGDQSEDGYEKIALYGDKDGDWTHAAKQEAGGSWTSKLGRGIDISHETPHAVAGPLYGQVAYYMKRAQKENLDEQGSAQEEGQKGKGQEDGLAPQEPPP